MKIAPGSYRIGPIGPMSWLPAAFPAAALNLTSRIWPHKTANKPGRLATYEASEISHDISFLEMLDIVNEDLTRRGEEPIAFDSDCREGICGSCGLVINGRPHGPLPATTVCQLH